MFMFTLADIKTLTGCVFCFHSSFTICAFIDILVYYSWFECGMVWETSWIKKAVELVNFGEDNLCSVTGVRNMNWQAAVYNI